MLTTEHTGTTCATHPGEMTCMLTLVDAGKPAGYDRNESEAPPAPQTLSRRHTLNADFCGPPGRPQVAIQVPCHMQSRSNTRSRTMKGTVVRFLECTRLCFEALTEYDSSFESWSKFPGLLKSLVGTETYKKKLQKKLRIMYYSGVFVFKCPPFGLCATTTKTTTTIKTRKWET